MLFPKILEKILILNQHILENMYFDADTAMFRRLALAFKMKIIKVLSMTIVYVNKMGNYCQLAASPLASSGYAAIGDWKGLCPFQTSIF